MICLYFMQGKCQKSADDCNFSHDAVPPRKFELCKFWMMDCCAKKEKCLYLHNDFPCKFYHTGLICKLGDKCKFSHDPLNEQTKNVLLKVCSMFDSYDEFYLSSKQSIFPTAHRNCTKGNSGGFSST